MRRMRRLLSETCTRWYNNNPWQQSAALAYYAIFAIAPLFIIAVAIAGLVFGVQATANQIVGAIDGLVGQELAMAIQSLLKNATRPESGKIATLIGIVTLFVGAAGVVLQLKTSLNAIWCVQPQAGVGMLAIVWEYMSAFLIVLGIGFFLLVSLALSAGMAAVSKAFPLVLPGGVALWQWIDLAVSVLLLTVLFALTYKILPAAKIAWRDVWIGALMTAVLFAGGKWLIGMYLSYSGVSSAYGAAGSLIVILLWAYYSAQVFLFGAEFTHVFAQRRSAELESPIPAGA